MTLLSKISNPAGLRRLSPELLPQISAEIRATIVDNISKCGGHLGSSLGATDIIVALHYVYDTPKDKLVFDTGHQAYAHKILTGRLPRFSTIRQKNGLSGFLRRDESEYDAFGAGHASTALSAALGMAAARDRNGEDYRVVAVVSDGCMTGGMALEALQNAAQLKTNILVILNDNQMFISHRVGMLGAYLTKILSRVTIKKAESRFVRFLDRFDIWGKVVLKILRRAKVIALPGMLFEELGFSYQGPIDGNDTKKLVEVLSYLKDAKGPVLLHVVTQKGKGYPPAEAKPIAYHGLGIFDKETGCSEKAAPGTPVSYTKVFSKTLLRLAEEDERIVAITAAMPEGTGLDAFRDKYPRRYFDVGIAEEHAVTFAAGLACGGLKPVVAVYSSFMQRAYDQVLHDVCLQKLPVVLALDRAGVVGEDGPTHHGVFDLSFLRNIPGLTVLAPMNENELQHALKTAFALNGPVAVRYPRGAGFGVPLDADLRALPLGKGQWLARGGHLTLLAIGACAHHALAAACELEKEGIACGVVNARFAKPLDTAIVLEAAARGPIITVEDNVLAGGFGSAVLEELASHGVSTPVLRLGIGDTFIEHASAEELYDMIGLSAGKIVAAARAWHATPAPVIKNLR